MVKALAIAILLFSLCGCMPDLCANAQISDAASPDGKLKAVTFRRDCGATTKYSVQVWIIPAKKPLPNGGGNVFVASGEPNIVVRWIDDRHLSISGGGSLGAFKAEKSFGDIEVTYN
jgi:hypothetical protein